MYATWIGGTGTILENAGSEGRKRIKAGVSRPVFIEVEECPKSSRFYTGFIT